MRSSVRQNRTDFESTRRQNEFMRDGSLNENIQKNEIEYPEFGQDQYDRPIFVGLKRQWKGPIV